MKSDPEIWRIAADIIAEHGPGAEAGAVRQANLMLDNGDREGQIEWLRVWTAIVLTRAEHKKSAHGTDTADLAGVGKLALP